MHNLESPTQLLTASKTQTASTQFQLLVAAVAASQRQQVGTDPKYQSLSRTAVAMVRTVECSYAQASSLCCKQGEDPAAARFSCQVEMFARAYYRTIAMTWIRIRGMELLGQTASVGCFREVRSVGKACLEAATWGEAQTAALGG